MAKLYSVPQNFSTTLNVGGGIDNSQTSSIVLTSVTGLPTDGGVLCFDWANPLDITKAEYIEYTGISGNTLTGVVRGAEGLSAKAHTNGCTVAGVISQMHVKRIKEKLDGTDTAGIIPTNLLDSNSNEVIKLASTASAVNEVTARNAITGTAPSLEATGDDSAINLKLKPKGTGVVVSDGAFNYGADAGSTDDYAITVIGVSAYVTGLHVRFKANTANTGAATLNVNSLGAKTIKKNKSSDLADNDIVVGQIVDVIYDGTNFQMQSQIANSSAVTANRALTIIPISSKANTNWSTFDFQSGAPLNFRAISGGSQNDNISFDVNLESGTYSFGLLFQASPDRGIFTVSIDGVSVGTIDSYSASSSVATRGEITGISVATSGVHTIQLKMATKNASSSGYFGVFSAFTLVKTA